MNKLTKRVLSVFLAVAMIVTILPPVTAQAATKTEKMTLYKGEIVKNYVYGTLKSVRLPLKSWTLQQLFPIWEMVICF